MKLVHYLGLLSIILITPSISSGTVLFEDDFESYTSTISNWNTSSNISLSTSDGINGSKCAKVAYTQAGTAPYWFSKSVAMNNISEVYVRFYFRTDAYSSGGSKFLKIFGKPNDPIGYANTTFPINYYSGRLFEIGYGDGTGTSNDSTATIRYSGLHSDTSVTVLASSGEFVINDSKWHSFEAHMKYNSNGQRNGIYRVWIDGALRIHATNIKNRNDANSMFINEIHLANYTNSNFSTPWNLYYDSVVISTEPIGIYLRQK